MDCVNCNEKYCKCEENFNYTESSESLRESRPSEGSVTELKADENVKKMYLLINHPEIKDVLRVSLPASLKTLAKFKTIIHKLLINFKVQSESSIRLFHFSSNEVVEEDFEDLDLSEIYFLIVNGQNFDKSLYLKYYGIKSFLLSETSPNKSSKIIVNHTVTKDIFRHQNHFVKRLKLPEETSIGYKNLKRSVFTEIMSYTNTLSSFKHSNKVDLKHSFAYNNDLVLIYEYVGDKISLEDYLKENTLVSERKCKLIMIQLIELLRFCHNRSIFHFNLNPKNILFTDATCTKVKLINFHIPLSHDDSNSNSSPYSPPDTSIRNGKIDSWAIGTIMYQMIYGETPFKTTNSNGHSRTNSESSLNTNDSVSRMLNLTFPKGRITQLCKEIMTKLLEPFESVRTDLLDESICNWFEAQEDIKDSEDVSTRIKNLCENRIHGTNFREDLNEEFKNMLMKKVKSSVYIENLSKHVSIHSLSNEFKKNIKDPEKYFEYLELQKLKNEQSSLKTYLRDLRKTRNRNSLDLRKSEHLQRISEIEEKSYGRDSSEKKNFQNVKKDIILFKSNNTKNTSKGRVLTKITDEKLPSTLTLNKSKVINNLRKKQIEKQVSNCPFTRFNEGVKNKVLSNDKKTQIQNSNEQLNFVHTQSVELKKSFKNLFMVAPSDILSCMTKEENFSGVDSSKNNSGNLLSAYSLSEEAFQETKDTSSSNKSGSLKLHLNLKGILGNCTSNYTARSIDESEELCNINMDSTSRNMKAISKYEKKSNFFTSCFGNGNLPDIRRSLDFGGMENAKYNILLSGSIGAINREEALLQNCYNRRSASKPVSYSSTQSLQTDSAIIKEGMSFKSKLNLKKRGSISESTLPKVKLNPFRELDRK